MTENHAIGSLSAVQLRDAIAAGTYTARQVTEHFLAVIGQQVDLGAFMAVDADAALAQGAQLAAAEAPTAAVCPLHAQPLAFRAPTLTSGLVTSFGSPLLADSPVPPEDGPVAQNAKTAGPVLVCKTTIADFAL